MNHTKQLGLTNPEIIEQTQKALLMFVALCKVQNQSYTQFLGAFRHEEKQKFNDLIRASESFAKTVRANMDDKSIEATNQLEDYFMEFCFTLIKGNEFNINLNR
jgi:hypothetical protein